MAKEDKIRQFYDKKRETNMWLKKKFEKKPRNEEQVIKRVGWCTCSCANLCGSRPHEVDPNSDSMQDFMLVEDSTGMFGPDLAFS